MSLDCGFSVDTNSTPICALPHDTHHSHELASVEINAVVEGEEAAQHQDEDGEEQWEVHESLASPVCRRVEPCYLQLCVRPEL